MLNLATHSGMPSRRFSTAILAGAWPHTDPNDCHTLATVQHRKGLDLLGQSDDIRAVATQVSTDQSGRTVTAFAASGQHLAGAIDGHADRYFAMARASKEIGHILNGLRADLDHIDAQAHTQIDQIASTATSKTAVLAQTRVIQVIATARTAAVTKAGTAATAISAHGTTLGITPSAPASSPDDEIVNTGRSGPVIRAVDNLTSTDPTPPGAQPQIGPFPVPPEVAAAAPPGTVNHPVDPTGGLLLPPTTAPPLAPDDPLLSALKRITNQAAPAPGPLGPDQIKALVDAEVKHQLSAAEKFSLSKLLGATVEGCAAGGVATGVVGAVTGPADPVVIAGGCLVGGLTDGLKYAVEHAGK
ncbi:hypothetical protein [Mycolicibacterium llatzerense]|uniref:hypothetical protein n=1 Tax=Mycolicibacterium llatzerense TaxID=280871 RepID=UPI0013A6EADC|nr:hypothetical protein [Mycolicibacterium llatzerense]